MKTISASENMHVLECLSSRSRIQILETLGLDGPQNIKTLAEKIGLSFAVVAKHVMRLENAGLISTELVAGKRGTQKICKLFTSEISIRFVKSVANDRRSIVQIPVGQYSSFEVAPTCGLASVEKVIGYRDDPRYFSNPEHVDASLVWFTFGWVEYRIPSYIIPPQDVKLMQITLEICSEYPNCREDWPSDIHFYINDNLLGVWVCPGDFGSNKGIYTPSWWSGGTEYGHQKVISITSQGTMLDGIPLSDTNLNDLKLQKNNDILFRIAIPQDCENVGGINIFGHGFGNYGQDIEVALEY